MTDTTPVLYAAYGSNLSVQRFACYLLGGSPPGSHVTHPVPPFSEPPNPVGLGQVAGRLRAAGHSPFWGGPAADVDLQAAGRVTVALYLQSPAAVCGLWAGEAGITPPPQALPETSADLPGAAHPWSVLTRAALVEPVAGHTHAYLVHTDGAAARGGAVPAAYLRTMIAGLQEHGMPRDEAARVTGVLGSFCH